MTHKLPLLTYENIYANYAAIEALHNISLEVYQNEIVTIIGANGAGKSTLLKALFNIPEIRHGKILFENTDLTQFPTNEIAHFGIALCPEGRRIFPKLTVEENLWMGGHVFYATKNKSVFQIFKQQLTKIFDLFPILKERLNQRAGTLSGGEQQMLAIGRALMGNPKLLLLDEPSLGLGPKLVHHIFAALKEIASMGTTLLLVEQNAHIALHLANRGYVLVNGEIRLSGPANELLNNPEVKKAYLGGS